MKNVFAASRSVSGALYFYSEKWLSQTMTEFKSSSESLLRIPYFHYIYVYMFCPVCIFCPCAYGISHNAYTRTGCLYAYGMPIRVWDGIFTEVLFYYKRLNLAQNSFIEVQTYRKCIIFRSDKYFYRRLSCGIDLLCKCIHCI